MNYIHYLYVAGWLISVGSRIVYELDYRKLLYVVPVQNTTWKTSCCPHDARRCENCYRDLACSQLPRNCKLAMIRSAHTLSRCCSAEADVYFKKLKQKHMLQISMKYIYHKCFDKHWYITILGVIFRLE